MGRNSLLNIFRLPFFNPFWLFEQTCFHWTAVAIVAAGVGGALISSSANKSAVNSANNTNLALQRETNAMNERLFHESRGSTGHAFLPEYFGDFERTLANDLRAEYAQMKAEDPARYYAMTQAVVDPAYAAGDQMVTDVLTDELLKEEQARADERALARRMGIEQGLEETTGRTLAARERGGLRGGSSVTNRMLLGDTIQARTAAALQDAEDRQAVADKNFDRKAAFIDAPLQREQTAISRGQIDSGKNLIASDTLQSRLGLFNIGTGQAPVATAGRVDAVPSNGAAVGSAIQQGSSALLDYYLKQQSAGG